MNALAITFTAGLAYSFAPAYHMKTPTLLRATVGTREAELGVLAPAGYFDPLGLSKDIDDELFSRYREGELKNGRAAMLGIIGYIVPEVYRWPGEIAPGLKFADIPNGVAAINSIPALGWVQIFFAVGALDYNLFGPEKKGWGEYNIGMPDVEPEEAERLRNSELTHCRLAMLAFFELLRHDSQNLIQPGFDGYNDLITGLPFLYAMARYDEVSTNDIVCTYA